MTPALRLAGWVLPASLVLLLALPFVALLFASSPAALLAGVQHPLFWPALVRSAQTTAVSLAIIVVTGTPLAWWLATARGAGPRVVEALVDAPIVVPPAVLGIALLSAFGRRGLLGPFLGALGIQVPFTPAAVVLAQVVVAAPFFVQSATQAFRAVDLDVLLVARTLGARPAGAFLRVALPLARPGLVAGAALAWARAVGEFGATLLFAGSLAGRTQTMPLAIYAALEDDVRTAVALALVLAGLSLAALVVLRGARRSA